MTVIASRIVLKVLRTAMSLALSGMPQEEALGRAMAESKGLDFKTFDRRSPAELRRDENEMLLAELLELERTRGRNAAALLARKKAVDPNDPMEINNLAQHLRRLRRKEKKNAQCAFPAQKAR
jgi:hypothetical protein